ncbi:MAG: hypothetical protein U0P30_10610 [Vicinamibacterales bacterium]
MGRSAWLSAFALSALVVASPAVAQVERAGGGDAAAPAGDTATTVSTRRLERIARRLHLPNPLRTAEASHVDFAVRVSGDERTRPVVEPGDLAIGAPVYGAPTHDEMLTRMTPAPLRSTAPYRRLRPSVSIGR